MTSYQFKNMLIVERGSNHSSVSQARDRYMAWFDQTKPFQYRSDLDKVIVFYPETGLNSGIQLAALSGVYSPPSYPNAYMVMLCDGVYIKVVKCVFTDETQFRTHMTTFRNYLYETIRRSGADIDQVRFTLYWENKFLTPNTRPILMQLGLLSADDHHVFTRGQIESNTPPMPIIGSTNMWKASEQTPVIPRPGPFGGTTTAEEKPLGVGWTPSQQSNFSFGIPSQQRQGFSWGVHQPFSFGK